MSTIRIRTLVVFLLAIVLAASAGAEISPDRYLAHVKALADERFKGRGNDQPELHQAAKYLAKEFRSCGLQPVNGSFYQKFQATVGVKAGPGNRLSANLPAEPRSYKSGADFVPLGLSNPGAVSAQVVFAGYGITAAEYHYDDYAHLDVKGKIVMVLRHEPQEQDEKSVFAGRQLTRHAGEAEKAVNARLHGAAALVLVNDSHPQEGDPDALMKLETPMGAEHLGLPAVQVRREVAGALLAGAGQTLNELQAAIDRDLSNHSLALPVKLEMNVDVTRRTRELENVVGILPGNNPALGEAIVIGAHYDHLGLGERHSLAPAQAGQIHHGADDNASGSAGLLELACDLATRRSQLKRSIVFLAFAGEELGLLGSGHYTRNPLLPLEKTAVMINLDMIGRPKERKIYVGGVGTAKELRSIVEEENRATNLRLEFSTSGYDSSDHTSFTARQVPVLFFFSGLHADYHRPSDTWEKIQGADAADILRLVEKVALRLDAQPERPLYVRVAEPAAPAGAGSGTGGYGPDFGSIPDFGEVERGVRFAGVREGSPAALAGLRAGDILVEFAGKPVQNLYDFTYLLRAHKPGDEVTVVVLRGTERITATVKLARRPGS